ncbi:MAG TPA: DUF2268 domain-containing putative Zn-dependent protease [Cyclobacteriaceae bacterium]|nr:DUF2268 domain-containing putative Zn-dependent protease [Cyclobacteriaceae bacterium]
MKKYTFIILLSLSIRAYSQDHPAFETGDIDNFWYAFDQLKFAVSKQDSIDIIQREYIDKATVCLKEFIKARDFTAKEYQVLIQRFPLFWNSVRPLTESIKNREDEIMKVLTIYESSLPDFKRPNVCFCIGALRTGGTVKNNFILIGSEIAAASPDVEKSEFKSIWLQSIIGATDNIVAMVSHEVIHTQQKWWMSTLVDRSLNEGVADFLSHKFTGAQINKIQMEYGTKFDCQLRKEFLGDFNRDKNDFSNWLYNGDNSKDRPADLGYYIGYRIAEEYYNKSDNKKKAIKNLLNRRRYMKIFKQSKYIHEDCEQ